MTVLTVLLYGVATLFQWHRRHGVVTSPSKPFLDEQSPRMQSASWLGCFMVGLVVCVLFSHALLLHHWIDVDVGQNLTLFNMLSLIVWLIAVMVVLMSIRKPLDNLLLFIFPCAMLSIVLVHCFPASYVVSTAAKPKTLVHILLSVLAFSMLCIAGLQAILVALQEQYLRSEGKAVGGIWMYFPPLQTMEDLLFHTVGFGFALLSMVVVTSLYFFFDKLSIEWVLDKAVLVGLAWLIFAALLIGRHWFGWRGRKAIYGTIAGVTLLIVAYLSCQLIIGP